MCVTQVHYIVRDTEITDRIFKRHGRWKSDKAKVATRWITFFLCRLFHWVFNPFSNFFSSARVAYYMMNVLNSVEWGSELKYKCIYHGYVASFWVLSDTLSQCFLSRASVYILRCLHLYSFESYDLLSAL